VAFEAMLDRIVAPIAPAVEPTRQRSHRRATAVTPQQVMADPITVQPLLGGWITKCGSDRNVTDRGVWSFAYADYFECTVAVAASSDGMTAGLRDR
jgi:hypothetical protein